MADSSLKSKAKAKGISESQSWERLPNEVLEIIFSFLDGRSIGRAHAVCRQWNIVLNYMSTGSLLWFNCCKSEILKYTLLHLCNHPIETHHRTSLEWKDIYIRWCTCRGGRFCEDDARLDVKKVVQRSRGEIQHQALLRYVCFTDDLVFVLEGDFLAVYDMHSDASIRAQLRSNAAYRYCPVSTTTVLMTTLGIHMPVDKRGKTDFQIAVDSTPLVVGTDFCLRIYVGLQCIYSVPLSTQLDKQVPMCSWYDTILLDSEYAEGLSVYRFNMNSTIAQTNHDLREECILHLPELYGATDSPVIAATIISDRILTLTHQCLTVWNADSAEIMSYVEQPYHPVGSDGRRDQTISWVGGIVATAQNIGALPAVLLYKLDEDCANIEKVTWLQHGIYPQSLRVLYDDSLWVINEGGSELLLRTLNVGASCKSNRTPQPTEIKGHIPSIGQPDRNPLSNPESNGERSVLLATAGTELSTPDCSRTELSNRDHDGTGRSNTDSVRTELSNQDCNRTDELSTHDHDRNGISTQDHSRIDFGTLDSNDRETLITAAIGGDLPKTGRTKLSTLDCSGDSSRDRKRDHCAKNETVPDVTIHPIVEHSRDKESVSIGAGISNYREGQESRHLSSSGSDASDTDLSSSTAAKTEEDVYRQSLSQLLGIGEDSTLWQNYSKSVHPKRKHFQADDEDDNEEEDEEDEVEDDEDHCVGHGDESGDDCCSLDNCDHPSSRGDQFGTTGKLYLTIRNGYTPYVVDIPLVKGITLTQKDIEQPEQIMPLDVRISHQGCEMIACRFAFTDSAVAMVSLCHSPCRDIFVLYK